MIDTIISLIVENMAKFDPKIDTSEASIFYNTVITPLLSRAESPTLQSDPIAYLKYLLHDYDATLDVSAGSAIDQVLIRPIAYIISNIKEELNWSLAAQNMGKSAELDGDELDNLADNFFVDRDFGTYSSVRVRVYYKSPKNLTLSPTVKFISIYSDEFIPTELSQTIDVSNYKRDGNLYYFELDLYANAVGSKSVEPHTIRTAEGLTGYVKIDNVGTDFDTTGNAEVKKDEFIKSVLPYAVGQNTTVSEQYLRRLLSTYIDQYVDIAINGPLSPTFERDIVIAKSIVPDYTTIGERASLLNVYGETPIHLGNRADILLKPKELVAGEDIVINKISPQIYAYTSGSTITVSGTLITVYIPNSGVNLSNIVVGVAAQFYWDDSGTFHYVNGIVISVTSETATVVVKTTSVATDVDNANNVDVIFYRTITRTVFKSSATSSVIKIPIEDVNFPLLTDYLLVGIINNVATLGIISSYDIVSGNLEISTDTDFSTADSQMLLVLAPHIDLTNKTTEDPATCIINPYKTHSLDYQEKEITDSGCTSLLPIQDTHINATIADYNVYKNLPLKYFNSTLSNPKNSTLTIANCTKNYWTGGTGESYLGGELYVSDKTLTQTIMATTDFKIGSSNFTQFIPYKTKIIDAGGSSYLRIWVERGAYNYIKIPTINKVLVNYTYNNTTDWGHIVLKDVEVAVYWDKEGASELYSSTANCVLDTTLFVADNKFAYVDILIDSAASTANINETTFNKAIIIQTLTLTNTDNIYIQGYLQINTVLGGSLYPTIHVANSPKAETVYITTQSLQTFTVDGGTLSPTSITIEGNSMNIKYKTSALPQLIQTTIMDPLYRVVISDLLARVGVISELYTTVDISGGDTNATKTAIETVINNLQLVVDIDVSDLIQQMPVTKVKLPWTLYFLEYTLSGTKQLVECVSTYKPDIHTAVYSGEVIVNEIS